MNIEHVMSYVIHYFAIGLCITGLIYAGMCVYRIRAIFSTFDDLIIKTLKDTAIIDKGKILVDGLVKFSDNDKKRKDKELIEMKAIIKSLTQEVRNLRNAVDHLKRSL